jgi:hypothetical protein
MGFWRGTAGGVTEGTVSNNNLAAGLRRAECSALPTWAIDYDVMEATRECQSQIVPTFGSATRLSSECALVQFHSYGDTTVTRFFASFKSVNRS